MRYEKLGSTGLEVSALTLGCMSWGDASRGGHQWVLDEDAGRAIIKDALEAGINFLDTANVYSAGSSEEITGRAVRDFAQREDVVLATKVHGRMRPGPNGAGLSRKAILHEIDASLTRLGTDYVDLYQIHRWDDATPIEETMEALHDVVQAGKARYIGASSMYAWQFSKAQHVADLGGWTRFVSMQDHYNLLYREEEREMLPLCQDQGVGVIPWSPLARGRLTRDWDADTARSETDAFGGTLYRDEDKAVVDTVAAVAERLAVPRAQVALAWLMHQPAVTSPIVGRDQAAAPGRRRRGRRPGARRRRPRGARRGLRPARRRRPPLTRDLTRSRCAAPRSPTAAARRCRGDRGEHAAQERVVGGAVVGHVVQLGDQLGQQRRGEVVERGAAPAARTGAAAAGCRWSCPASRSPGPGRPRGHRTAGSRPAGAAAPPTRPGPRCPRRAPPRRGTRA